MTAGEIAAATGLERATVSTTPRAPPGKAAPFAASVRLIPAAGLPHLPAAGYTINGDPAHTQGRKDRRVSCSTRYAATSKPASTSWWTRSRA